MKHKTRYIFPNRLLFKNLPSSRENPNPVEETTKEMLQKATERMTESYGQTYKMMNEFKKQFEKYAPEIKQYNDTVTELQKELASDPTKTSTSKNITVLDQNLNIILNKNGIIDVKVEDNEHPTDFYTWLKLTLR